MNVDQEFATTSSVVPTAFWVFSIGGGVMLLGYALYRKDPVFITGQAVGAVVYLRNLMLIYRNRAEATAATTPTAPPVPTQKT